MRLSKLTVPGAHSTDEKLDTDNYIRVGFFQMLYPMTPADGQGTKLLGTYMYELAASKTE